MCPKHPIRGEGGVLNSVWPLAVHVYPPPTFLGHLSGFYLDLFTWGESSPPPIGGEYIPMGGNYAYAFRDIIYSKLILKYILMYKFFCILSDLYYQRKSKAQIL